MEFIFILQSLIKNLILTGVATDSHRLSSSSISLNKIDNFKPFILPKKAVFQLCNLIQENNDDILLNLVKQKFNLKLVSQKSFQK